MHQEEFQRLLKKFRQGRCSPEEEALVDHWFRSMESPKETPLPEKIQIQQRSWTKIHEHIRHGANKESPPTIVMRPSWTLRNYAGAIAAAVLLAMVFSVFLFIKPEHSNSQVSVTASKDKTVINESATVKSIFLADGSEVVLEPNSSIHYREPFDQTQRVVSLEGEAFFSIQGDPSRPFLVNTKEVVTKVLGTSFTISAFPNEDNVIVSVRTGKVSVTTRKERVADSGSPEETILTPNQKMTYNKVSNLVSRGIVAEPVPIVPDDVVKRLHFEAAPIAEIFEALEEVYGVDIAFDEEAFSSCILTTTIADGNIYNRLDMICNAIDARYTVEENAIVVSGRGCGK